MKHKKWFEKKVDERQELDLLRVEHGCFWAMYWMLLAAIFVQAIFMEGGFRLMAAEWMVFMATSILLVAGCVRKGVWGFHTQKVPGVVSYFKYSLVSAAVGIFFGFLFGSKNSSEGTAGILACAVVYGILFFAVSFIAFSGVGFIAKKREEKLAVQEIEDDEE